MNILQDILGLFTRRKIVKTLQSNDYIPLGTFKSKKEALKPNPKMESVLISAIDLKTYMSGGGSSSEGYIQTGTTANATPFLLTSSKAIANGTVQSFITRVTAISTVLGNVWCHEFRGAIKQFGGVTSIVDTVTDEMIAEDVATAAWGTAITAVPGSMSVTVTGAAVDIKWKAETIFSEIVI